MKFPGLNNETASHYCMDLLQVVFNFLRLYSSRLGESERGAVLYERYLQETEDAGLSEDRGQAYQFLANHCLNKNLLDLACEYAHKCTLFMEVRAASIVL